MYTSTRPRCTHSSNERTNEQINKQTNTPSQDTPFSALALAEICQRAGVPDGCVNVVPCGRERAQEVGLVLTTHPTVKKFSFTGSTMVGKVFLALARTSAHIYARTLPL